MKKCAVACLLLLLVVLSACNRGQSIVGEPPVATDPIKQDILYSGQHKFKAEVYYPDLESDGFYTEELETSGAPSDILSALVKKDVLGREIKINSFTLFDKGKAVAIDDCLRYDSGTLKAELDFSNSFSEYLSSMGKASEQMTLYAVVNSFTSFYGLQSITITCGGEPLVTTNGSYPEPLSFQIPTVKVGEEQKANILKMLPVLDGAVRSIVSLDSFYTPDDPVYFWTVIHACVTGGLYESELEEPIENGVRLPESAVLEVAAACFYNYPGLLEVPEALHDRVGFDGENKVYSFAYREPLASNVVIHEVFMENGKYSVSVIYRDIRYIAVLSPKKPGVQGREFYYSISELRAWDALGEPLAYLSLNDRGEIEAVFVQSSQEGEYGYSIVPTGEQAVLGLPAVAEVYIPKQSESGGISDLTQNSLSDAAGFKWFLGQFQETYGTEKRPLFRIKRVGDYIQSIEYFYLP